MEQPTGMAIELAETVARTGRNGRGASVALSLAGALGADAIQDLFETEMDEDGYFEEEN